MIMPELKKTVKAFDISYFPKGFVTKIKEGRRVNTETIAINIASPVNIPK